MTDMAAATAALAGCEGAEAAAAREEALALFYARHARGNDLLLCKWLAMQARPGPAQHPRARAHARPPSSLTSTPPLVPFSSPLPPHSSLFSPTLSPTRSSHTFPLSPSPHSFLALGRGRPHSAAKSRHTCGRAAR